MSLFANPQEHAANPPDTWAVELIGPRCWHLVATNGATLETHATRREAERAKTDGHSARLWVDERTWYAGGSVRGWKPYAPAAGVRVD